MGSSWENCPRKGLSEKKRGEKKRKRNLVSFPILLGNIHQGHSLLFGGEQSHCSPKSTRWLGHTATAKPLRAEVRRLEHVIWKDGWWIWRVLCFLFALPWELFPTEKRHYQTASALPCCDCYVLCFFLHVAVWETLALSMCLRCYWARLHVSAPKPNEWVTTVFNRESLGNDVISWRGATLWQHHMTHTVLMKFHESGHVARAVCSIYNLKSFLCLDFWQFPC